MKIRKNKYEKEGEKMKTNKNFEKLKKPVCTLHQCSFAPILNFIFFDGTKCYLLSLKDRKTF